jgi:hypothetical protein
MLALKIRSAIFSDVAQNNLVVITSSSEEHVASVYVKDGGKIFLTKQVLLQKTAVRKHSNQFSNLI